MKKFKVSFIGFVDYANVMTEYSMGINTYSKNYESKVICYQPHKFNYKNKHDYDIYPQEKKRINNETIKKIIKWVKESTHIIIAEEFKSLYPTTKIPLSYKSLPTISKIFGSLQIDVVKDTKAAQLNNLHLFHTGRAYRNQYKLFNQIGDINFNKIIYSLDLFHLSSRDTSNKHLAFYSIIDKKFNKSDVLKLIDEKFETKEITILHIPSSREHKGTKAIINNVTKVINQLNKKGPIKYKLVVPPKLIPFNEVMELKKNSHIYIDQFNTWGGVGVSGIESLMLGNLTFSTTQFTTIEAIRAANKNLNCGEDFHFIHLGVTHEEFINTLNSYLKKSISEIKEITKKSVEWGYKILTHKAISHKFEKEVFE